MPGSIHVSYNVNVLYQCNAIITTIEQVLKSGIRQASKEVFEADGVTITLKWAQWKPLYSYFTDIIPSVPIMTGNTSVTIKISYNIQYNASVSAMHLYGETNISIFTQLFHYYNSEYVHVKITL